jgi:hypothetical protein
MIPLFFGPRIFNHEWTRIYANFLGSIKNRGAEAAPTFVYGDPPTPSSSAMLRRDRREGSLTTNGHEFTLIF